MYIEMIMKTKSIILLLVCLVSSHIQAQKLTVQGMKATNDLSASQDRRKDLNNEMCGLVKVRLTEKNATFEGNIIPPVIYKNGEYWVYMTKGSKELHILHPNYVPVEVKFNDYGIARIQSLATYTLTLLKPAVTEDPAPVETFHVSGVPFRMVLVEKGNKSDLKPYFIGQMEVTQELWEIVMEKNPSHFKGSTRPVESVSKEDCKKFIDKLNAMTGQEFRLPNEDEWEYAAKGGRLSKGYKYAGSNNLKSVAWLGEGAGTEPATNSVASKAPNELGIYDMSGNVWEWCDKANVARGGGVGSDAAQSTISSRRTLATSSAQNNVGLRLAISVKDIKSGKESSIMNYDGIPIVFPNATEEDLDDMCEDFEEAMVEQCVKARVGTGITKDEFVKMFMNDCTLTWLILISDNTDAKKKQWINELKGIELRDDKNPNFYTPKARDLILKLYKELYNKLRKKAGKAPVNTTASSTSAASETPMTSSSSTTSSTSTTLGTTAASTSTSASGNDGKVYDVVDNMPQFAGGAYTYKDAQGISKTVNIGGGQSGLFQYLSLAIKYPLVAEENGIQGRVICTFVVETDGSITDVKIVKSVNPALDKEAVRVISSMPKWKPGTMKGEAVRVKYTIPVTFSLK